MTTNNCINKLMYYKGQNIPIQYYYPFRNFTFYHKNHNVVVQGLIMDTKKPENKHVVKKDLPTIKCKCGHQIVMLSDAEALSMAIDNHILEHKNQGATNDQIAQITESLIIQALKKAAKTEN